MQHIPPPTNIKRKGTNRMNTRSRDVSKFLNEFQELRTKSKDQAGNIYADELDTLYNMGKGQQFETMWLSFKFGFIAGLHYAKNQRKK